MKEKKRVFKENLTSKLLQKESLRILKDSKNLKICEIGCGDGNISNFLIKNMKYDNFFYLSDISNLAIKRAKKKTKYDRIEFKTGDLFKPWLNKKFDIVISDVSSINQTVAQKSPWYIGIDSNCGTDGLKNVKKIIRNLNHYLKEDGILIIPIISLSDTDKLRNLLNSNFKFLNETNRIYWPLPNFFQKNIKLFDRLLEKNLIYFEKKFGQHIAYTSVAICKKIKKGKNVK
jgi:methylase of polypeptide subunit release factors